MSRIQQVREASWPSGDSHDIAVLEISFDELLARLGFEEEKWLEQGLGEIRGFGFRSHSGALLLVGEYPTHPEPTVTLIADSGRVVQEGPEEVLRGALDALTLPERAVSWVLPPDGVAHLADRLAYWRLRGHRRRASELLQRSADLLRSYEHPLSERLEDLSGSLRDGEGATLDDDSQRVLWGGAGSLDDVVLYNPDGNAFARDANEALDRLREQIRGELGQLRGGAD